MRDPEDSRAKAIPPATPDAGDVDRTRAQPDSKNYYYDDSTGYEIYQGPDEEDDDLHEKG